MANALRALAMDAVQAANSGHPGMPMGMAEIALALWSRHLRHNPADPHWANRDRFMLSNGHGSMLQYATAAPDGLRPADRRAQALPPAWLQDAGASGIRLHAGRGNHYRAAGPGRRQRASGWRSPRECWPIDFNRPGLDVVDHHTYVFMGDGCMMEGISHEACALAGTLGLGKLVVVLRRQRHLDRLGKRPHRPVVHRQRARALQGLRLAGDPPGRRPRRRGGRQGDPQGASAKRRARR